MPPKRIPKKFYQYFWDVDVKKLNPQKYPYFVIARLLDKGDIEAVRWVRKHFDDNLVKETLKKYRDFSLKSASFWATIYQVPKTQVKCFQQPYLSMRKKHWPY